MQDILARADKAYVPGVLHQGILALFRDDPWLAFDLLGLDRPATGTPVDRRAEIDIDDRFPKLRQGFPDLVLVGREADNPDAGVVITVEAQNEFDPAKRWRIVVYQALLAERHQLQTWVVVVSFSRRVSAALRSWRVGPPPRVDALLLDADTVHRSPWLECGTQRPAATVLTAALHGRRGDVEAARVGLQAARGLPDAQRHRYAGIVFAALSKPHRDQLIGELPVDMHDPLIQIERESGSFFYGKQEGLEQGRREALLDLTLGMLIRRGLAVSPAAEARLRACESIAKLREWALRAAEIDDVEQLFAE